MVSPLAQPFSLLHDDPGGVIQMVEEAEEDRRTHTLLTIRLGHPLHQKTKVAGPAAPHSELQSHIEVLALLYEDPEDLLVPDADVGRAWAEPPHLAPQA